MTEKEKIKKLDALEEINSKISGCFGEADKIFAGHKYDEDRAKAIRKLAKQSGVTFTEIQNIVAGFLYRTGFPSDHSDKQMLKVTKFFKNQLE